MISELHLAASVSGSCSGWLTLILSWLPGTLEKNEAIVVKPVLSTTTLTNQVFMAYPSETKVMFTAPAQICFVDHPGCIQIDFKKKVYK